MYDSSEQENVGRRLPFGQELRLWSGEFVDSAAERAFEQHVATAELRSFLVALYTTGPLYFAFVIADYILLGTGVAFVANFVLRLAGMGVCFGLAAVLRRRRPAPAQLYRLSFYFFIALLTDALVIYPLSQRSFLEIYPGLLVMMVGAFFFVPSRQLYRLIATFYGVVGVTIEASLWYPPHDVELPLAILFFVVSLVFCLVASRQQTRQRRLSFLDAMHNRQLTHLLLQEIGLRRKLEEEARVQARTDELTGLPNRRRFFELAEMEVARMHRYPGPVAMVMFDLDHFKSINDQYGHAAGDQALRVVGEVCRHVLRTNDIAGRIGGEEFAVMLPETSLEGATDFAERLREAIATSAIATAQAELRLTATLGVAAAVVGEVVSLDELLARADAALYLGKEAGRNRVMADQPMENVATTQT